MTESLLLEDEEKNGTARDKGKQFLGMQRIQKNACLWKSREETLPRRVWLRVSQTPRIQPKIILDCKVFVHL